MSSGATAQDGAWKAREQSEESRYAHEKEKAQLEAIRANLKDKESQASSTSQATSTSPSEPPHEYEGGHGGQEDLIDRYATTSGEH